MRARKYPAARSKSTVALSLTSCGAQDGGGPEAHLAEASAAE